MIPENDAFYPSSAQRLIDAINKVTDVLGIDSPELHPAINMATANKRMSDLWDLLYKLITEEHNNLSELPSVEIPGPDQIVFPDTINDLSENGTTLADGVYLQTDEDNKLVLTVSPENSSFFTMSVKAVSQLVFTVNYYRDLAEQLQTAAQFAKAQANEAEEKLKEQQCTNENMVAAMSKIIYVDPPHNEFQDWLVYFQPSPGEATKTLQDFSFTNIVQKMMSEDVQPTSVDSQ